MTESGYRVTEGVRTERGPAARRGGSTLALIWLAGLVTVAGVKYRALWPSYVDLHRWISARGVPDVVRGFDSLLIFTTVAFIAAWLVGRSQGASARRIMQLQSGRSGWSWMCAAALAPMILGGAALGMSRVAQNAESAEIANTLLRLVIKAPWTEEIFYRGMLAVVPAALIGWRGPRFRANAAASSFVFGIGHIAWSLDGVQEGWSTLLVTFAGGLWFIWLVKRWESLWVPMILHAGMNLGWTAAAASGGAGGGGLTENLLRVATIVIATVWTARATRVRRSVEAGIETAPKLAQF